MKEACLSVQHLFGEQAKMFTPRRPGEPGNI